MFLISWFFYLFLLCSISLLVKYDFILRYEAWVNAIRTSSCIEKFPQISAKPIAFQRNLLGKLPWNRPFFTNRFSAKQASKIPAKSPRNWPSFPRICRWKSGEIWLFFPRPTRSPEFNSRQYERLYFYSLGRVFQHPFSSIPGLTTTKHLDCHGK